MPLYQIDSQKHILQIKPTSFVNERELQRLFERNSESLLGVRFIASEFTTGDRQRGRIDTLGLDQDGFPTIVEFKKTSKENIINQGLFYLDWLVDHKGDFIIAAQQKLGNDGLIDWSSPRLVLIAESFSEYDKYAVNRIGSNIELWTYRRYGEALLLLELIFSANQKLEKKVVEKIEPKVEEIVEIEVPVYTVEDHLTGKSKPIQELFEQLRERIFALGDDEAITEKANKKYIGYKHGKNFCELWIQANKIKIWLDITLNDLNDPYKLVRDVSKIGHWGTGDVELNLENIGQLDAVMALIQQSYQQTI